MNWVIAYDDTMEVVRATVSGDMTVEGINAMTAELLAESRRRDSYRTLCDCREAGLYMDGPEVHRLPAELQRLGVKSYHMFALVYTPGPGATPLFKIFDDRCYNIGLNHRVFTDCDLAGLWLTGIDWTFVSGPICAAA